jgi:integrase
MSPDPVSRALLGPTLAEVLSAVSATDLKPAQRQDMASAVRTVARALDRRPEHLSADPALLRPRLAALSAAALGLSEGRWANVRSLLLKAIALTRPVLPGRSCKPLSPAWLGLHQALPQRGDAHRLARLFRWLGARGIGPDAVTLGDLEAFGIGLREATLSKSPEKIWREICWVWNKAQRTIPGWPSITLEIPKKREPYTFPWTYFPPSLKSDADCYLARLGGQDLLEDVPFRPVRPETLATRERQVRTFASALVRRGRDPTSLRRLADLVALDAFRDGLRFFLERNNNQSSGYIFDLAATLKAIATHYVKPETETLDKIKEAVTRLKVPSKGLTRRNRDRLRPFDDPANVEALVRLPVRLMKEANSDKLKPRPAALLAQTAVAIEVLLMTALRLKNLLALEFDKNLVASGSTLHVVFEEHETKNRGVIDIPLPRESTELIKEYRDRHLPCLAGPEEHLLFPGKDGGSKSRSTFRGQLSRTILRNTGLQMNPHLFRHARAKIHLDRHVGEYAVVSTALGHASIDTTRTYYTGFESKAVMQHFDEVILKLRRGPRGGSR